MSFAKHRELTGTVWENYDLWPRSTLTYSHVVVIAVVAVYIVVTRKASQVNFPFTNDNY